MDGDAHIRSLLVSGTYFPPQVGGISRMMAETCRQLGPGRVAVVTGQDAAPADPALQGIRVYRSPSAFGQGRRTQFLHLAGLLGRALVKERPALLQFATADDAWIAWYTARLTGLPHVIYAHGNEILALCRSGWHKPREAFRKAAMIIANSRYTADLVAQGLGVPQARIRVVPPGCDVETFRPVAVPEGLRERLTGRPDAFPVLLSVGNLVERKGHDLVIRALPELRQLLPKISYVIVGEGRDREMLEALCRSLEVADIVRFAGRGIDADLASCYSASDLFVMPSRARLDQNDVEGFGIVFLEAAACGKAVIGGRSGGIADAVDEGRTGLLVDPLSTGEFVAAVKLLVESPGMLGRFGEAGRIRANRDFTWALYGARIEKILAEVAGMAPHCALEAAGA